MGCSRVEQRNKHHEKETLDCNDVKDLVPNKMRVYRPSHETYKMLKKLLELNTKNAI